MPRRLQVVLGEADEVALRELIENSALSESELVRVALRHLGERLVGPDDMDLIRAEVAAAKLKPAWWSALADELERRHQRGQGIETDAGVYNGIVHVDKAAGRLELISKRSRSGNTRTITVEMLERAETVTMHATMVRRLRALAEELLAATPKAKKGWEGPFRVARLLDASIDASQPWPPEDLGVYLVSCQPWTKTPTRACEPLYVGSTTGRTPRFATLVGDLVADMFGFYGTTTGHNNGGQRIWRWCDENRVKPGHLFLGWYTQPGMCPRCEAARASAALRPQLNVWGPPRCTVHPSS